MHRKKVILLFPFVLALVLLTGWLQLARLDAAAPGNITQASHNSTLIYLNQIGGTTHSVIVEGTYAYVGTGPRLQIFDLQTPANPVLVGQSMAMRGRVVSVQVTGNYAFVLSSGSQDPINQHPNELYILDITNPVNPIGVSTTPLAGRPTEITLAGNYAYIAAEPVWNGVTWDAGGLYILDVTNPGLPVIVGQYAGDVRAFDIAVQGNYAYVAAVVTMVSSLVVLDISNPASPTVLNSINLAGIPQGVYLTGNLLYLALSEQGIAAYSLANPTNPSLVGGSDTPSTAYDLVIEGSYAYVADFTGGLRIIDVTNPANMNIVGNYNAPGTNATYNVDVSGAYAYVAYSTDGLKTVDVSSPSNPQEVSSYKDVGYVAEVAAANSLLYTIEEAGVNALRIYDATDPLAVTELGAYTGTFSLYDVVISNTHAYLGGGGLRVVDISNSSDPTLIGYLNAGTVYDVEIANAYAYLVRNNNILIADISNPTNPMAMGSLPVSSPDEIDIAGSHAFVASSQGMAIINISNPMSPALVTTYNPYSGEVNALALKGNYAYLAVETEGVYVLDISNPANPLPAGFTAASATNYQEAYISGNDLYVSAGTNGIHVYDLSNPTEPVLSDSYDTAGYTWGTFHTGTRLYAGDNYGGLYIFSTSTLPGLSVSNEAAMEGNGGFPNLLFEIHLSAPSTRTITVSYTTVDGTAQAGSDYIATSGTLTFQPGSTLEHVPVSLIPDTVLEPDEMFSLVISDPVNAVITDNNGAGTIINDDLPEMFISDSTVVEGDSGTQTATFTVTLSAPGTLHVAASYQTFDGTAQAGSDYAAANGSIFIPAGQTTQVISMTIYGDSDIEPDETFTVEIAKENNVILADYIGVGMILNDDVEETNATVYLPLMLKP